jgi:hypothetical protein
MPSAATTLAQPSSQLEQLQELYQHLKDRFHTTHDTASSWLRERSMNVEDFRTASQQLLAVTSLAGAVAMHKPVDTQVLEQLQSEPTEHHNRWLVEVTADEHQEILNKMKSFVTSPPGHLPRQEELYLEQQLTDMLGFEVLAELEGHRLNHSIGIMGGEQHLKRFPTDTLEQHDAVREAGIAPNRGAFGWFTDQGQLTAKAIEREKYYFAVQTLYLPDWNTNHAQLKPWYKFRKMIAINPAEEVAVVGVVGDAGPALSVKKQFGGSPEVIREAKIWSPKARGRVLLFFVDDPNDEIPLGVIDLSVASRQKLAARAAQSSEVATPGTPEAGASADITGEQE